MTSRRAKRFARKDDVIALDLGTQTAKAVWLGREGDAVVLRQYALIEALPAEESATVGGIVELIARAQKALGSSSRRLAVVVGSADCLVAQVEMPGAPRDDLRRMLQLSPKTYIQQDLAGHVFDCVPRVEESDNGQPRTRKKSRTLAAAMKMGLLERLQDAARQAGVTLELVAPTQVAMANAFLGRAGEGVTRTAALLDIGFKQSTIGLLVNGELTLTRSVALGGEKLGEIISRLTEGIEGLTSAEADELHARLQGLVASLAKEVRASMDFLHTLMEAQITHVFVSGGSARSQFVLQTLEAELQMPCETWSASRGMGSGLPKERAAELDFDDPQLVAAIGAALSVLREDLIPLNMLAEAQAAAEQRRRDPVRRASWCAACLIGAMLSYLAFLWWQGRSAERAMIQAEAGIKAVEGSSSESVQSGRLARELEKTLEGLNRQPGSRVLLAPVLSALQFCVVDGIQFHSLRIEQIVTKEAPVKAVVKDGKILTPEKPGATSARLVLSITGKNHSGVRTIDGLIERVASHPFFKANLRTSDPVLLRDMKPPQVDPGNPEASFVMFTIECAFPSRTYKND